MTNLSANSLTPPASGVRPACREESAVHQDGWNAAYDGEPATACPYSTGTRQALLWGAGWSDYKASRG